MSKPHKPLSAKAQARVDWYLAHETPTRPSFFWKWMRMLARLTTSVMFSTKFYGLEHVPPTGGGLLASSHQSYLDPMLVGVRVWRPVAYMANAYLFANPLFGCMIRNVHAFPVQQGKGDRSAVNTCIQKLKEGHALCIFPEGHRTPDGEIKPLQGGAARIARRAQVPIVPVVVDGAFDAWPRKRKLPRPRPVHVMYGPPIETAGLSASEITALLEERLRAMFEELKGKRRESGWY